MLPLLKLRVATTCHPVHDVNPVSKINGDLNELADVNRLHFSCRNTEVLGIENSMRSSSYFDAFFFGFLLVPPGFCGGFMPSGLSNLAVGRLFALISATCAS